MIIVIVKRPLNEMTTTSLLIITMGAALAVAVLLFTWNR